MGKYFVFIWMILCAESLAAQDSLQPVPIDTPKRVTVVRKPPAIRKPVLQKTDSTKADSVLSPVRIDLGSVARKAPLTDSILYAYQPYYRFTDPIHYSITIKKWEGKEPIFYSIIALLIFFALIRNGFHRYLDDLVKTFFRTTVKQRQTKEQLVQSPLPSLLLNIFFLLSIGMFLALLLQYFKLGMQFNFWILFLYCVIGLMAIYAAKYITLRFFGWIFQVSEAIDSYIFIVFATNKIIGIALLPFLVILAFTFGSFNQVAMTLSIAVVLGLLAYRFFLSYITIHRQVRISLFHFFLYLCAFEIIPLLLINKLLFRFLGETS
jgi:hypothetical protein